MENKVFIVQDDGRKNLSPALKFGNIVVLATRDMSTFSDTTRQISQIRSKLNGFDPSRDYLLLSGDPLLIGVATHLVAENHREVPCLKWDRMSMDYIPVTLKF